MKFSATILTIGDEIRRNSSSSSNQKNEEMSDITSIYTYMLGRFNKIASISHPNLCKNLELIKCLTVTSGFVIIAESYAQNYLINHDSFLNNRIGKSESKNLLSIAQQICTAIEFCHENEVTIGCLDIANLMIVENPQQNSEQIQVKLSNFGLNYILDDYFNEIRPAICSIYYQPPECILNILLPSTGSNYFIDIWSFGILLIELFSGWRLSEIFNPKQFLSVQSSILCKSKNGSICADLLDAIAKICPAFGKRRTSLEPILHIITKCLNVNPSKRPAASEIKEMLEDALKSNPNSKCTPSSILDENIEEMKVRIGKENELEKFGFTNESLKELYFIWKLCGSSVENILIRKGILKTRPPISTIPNLLIENNQFYGNEETRQSTPIAIFPLPMNNLLERLCAIPNEKKFINFELGIERKGSSEGENSFSDEMEIEQQQKTSMATAFINQQSLVVKERDITYQYQRMRLFRHLLSSWPHKAQLLRDESRHDIPPVYRGKVWAALLDVLPFDGDGREELFYGLDTYSEHQSDRQLQVDIPRCHQYDELMSSPMAHYQMKLLLKAVLVSRKDEFVYWQGLDSLTAPFLILHFNDLPTAFRCLNSFIDRYLHGFFQKDNTTIIRNYLAEFMRVIEFADSELFTHLISLDFHPELFAIPWFLTCFAHVLPLHKLFHLWDALLLADVEFPLFIGVAILLQMRSKLIVANFNEAILLFSDLPDLQIDNVVNTAKLYYNKWQAAEK